MAARKPAAPTAARTAAEQARAGAAPVSLAQGLAHAPPSLAPRRPRSPLAPLVDSNEPSFKKLKLGSNGKLFGEEQGNDAASTSGPVAGPSSLRAIKHEAVKPPTSDSDDDLSADEHDTHALKNQSAKGKTSVTVKGIQGGNKRAAPVRREKVQNPRKLSGPAFPPSGFVGACVGRGAHSSDPTLRNLLVNEHDEPREPVAKCDPKSTIAAAIRKYNVLLAAELRKEALIAELEQQTGLVVPQAGDVQTATQSGVEREEHVGGAGGRIEAHDAGGGRLGGGGSAAASGELGAALQQTSTGDGGGSRGRTTMTQEEVEALYGDLSFELEDEDEAMDG